MLRIVSGRSANTEQEERVFNTLKTIANNTSNHHPDHVLLNSMIRLQVREEVIPQEGRMQDEVRKLANGLPIKSNTIIPFWIIDMFEWVWQSHLEKIADFILEECWWVETDEGIMFNDLNKNLKTKYHPHHFRSWDIQRELSYLEDCWKTCLNTVCIPARRIKDQQESIIKLESINFFKSTIQTEDNDHTRESTTTNPVSPLEKNNSGDENVIEKTGNYRSKCDVTYNNETSSVNAISDEKQNTKNKDKDNLISLKPIIKPLQRDIKSLFKTRTAQYIYEVIPKELVLIQKYDNARTKAKNNNFDKLVHEIFCDVSAEIEVKLMIKFEQLEKQMNSLEMKQICNSKKLNAIPEEGSDKEEFENIDFKLKIIRALRHDMKF